MSASSEIGKEAAPEKKIGLLIACGQNLEVIWKLCQAGLQMVKKSYGSLTMIAVEECKNSHILDP